jgi:hypothetical protein
MSKRGPSVLEYEAVKREADVYRRMYETVTAQPGDMPVAGCGDSSCIVESARSRGGQNTNGGCRCEAHKLRSAMAYWKRRAEFLQETIRLMKEASRVG